MDALRDLLSTEVAVQGYIHPMTLVEECLLLLLIRCMILAPSLRVLLEVMPLVVISEKQYGEVLYIGRALALVAEFRLSSEVDTQQAFK